MMDVDDYQNYAFVKDEKNVSLSLSWVHHACKHYKGPTWNLCRISFDC